ncbi:hypothetical protein ACJX0J_009576 [Zea mays]
MHKVTGELVEMELQGREREREVIRRSDIPACIMGGSALSTDTIVPKYPRNYWNIKTTLIGSKFMTGLYTADSSINIFCENEQITHALALQEEQAYYYFTTEEQGNETKKQDHQTTNSKGKLKKGENIQMETSFGYSLKFLFWR